MSTKGALIHAFGGQTFDYYLIADNCARLVKKFLGLPVSLVTDKHPANHHLYDQVILQASNSDYTRTLRNVGSNSNEMVHYVYKNDTRSQSLELSPYDVTLLLDSDYLVLNSDLLKFMDLGRDFLCPWFACDVTNQHGYEGFRYIKNTIPQAWATTVIFNKSPTSLAIFNYWQLIQQNYEYYKALMGVGEHFRNDYALSLAAHTLNGCQPMTEKLPQMMMLPGHSYIEKIAPNRNVIINCNNQVIKLSKTSLHVMNKLCLQSDKITQNIYDITA